MREELQKFMRAIPSMDLLLALPWVEPLERELGRDAVKDLMTEAISEIRREARDGQILADADVVQIVEERARQSIEVRARSSLCPVINATGVVVHTNLGRSPLPPEALNAVLSTAKGYSTLEYSLATGSRGQRNSHVEWLLCQATGAEAAIVVNNNAGAVLLALTALARGRSVVVSRGELVEIGGSFRIPDVLAFSGAEMSEVGTTNCTHLRDYRDAITENTVMLLKVHPSNFFVQGFTESVSREELSALARGNGLICMEDLGSGLLEALDSDETPALDGEPTVKRCLEAGVDIVTFSGDKLLGGPQIGCIAGSRELIARIRDNQLARALRVDKMTLAAFEAILRLYLKGQSDAIPTIRMLRTKSETLKAQAEELLSSIVRLFSELGLLPAASPKASLTETSDVVGGGAFPAAELPGWGVALTPGAGIKAEKLASRLRSVSVPVITGIRGDRLIFHVRTLLPGDEKTVVAALREIFTRNEMAKEGDPR